MSCINLSYFNSIIYCHPFHMQLLSFLGIGMHFQSCGWSFFIGQIVEKSLLNSLLFSSDDVLDYIAFDDEISANIVPILS